MGKCNCKPPEAPNNSCKGGIKSVEVIEYYEYFEEIQKTAEETAKKILSKPMMVFRSIEELAEYQEKHGHNKE